MKIKTSELTGAALRWAVSMAHIVLGSSEYMDHFVEVLREQNKELGVNWHVPGDPPYNPMMPEE